MAMISRGLGPLCAVVSAEGIECAAEADGMESAAGNHSVVHFHDGVDREAIEQPEDECKRDGVADADSPRWIVWNAQPAGCECGGDDRGEEDAEKAGSRGDPGKLNTFLAQEHDESGTERDRVGEPFEPPLREGAAEGRGSSQVEQDADEQWRNVDKEKYAEEYEG